MKTLSLDLPDRIAQEADDYVKTGFFKTLPDFFVAAVLEFVRHHKIDMMDRYALDDINWALQQKKESA
jgi:hypothetical protein